MVRCAAAARSFHAHRTMKVLPPQQPASGHGILYWGAAARVQTCRHWALTSWASLLAGDWVQVTPLPIMQSLLLPSLVCLVIPMALMTWAVPELQPGVAALDSAVLPLGLPAAGEASASSTSSTGSTSSTSSATSTDSSSQINASDGALEATSRAAAAVGDDLSGAASSSGRTAWQAALDAAEASSLQKASARRSQLILVVGAGVLMSVPLFRYATGLPPYMGVLSGLAVLWLLTDALQFGEGGGEDGVDRPPRVNEALRNIDLEGILFFLGILLAVSALEVAGARHTLHVLCGCMAAAGGHCVPCRLANMGGGGHAL